MTKEYIREVKNCYNLTAKEYSKKFLNELKDKPFDRNMLDRFSEMLPEKSLVYDFGCGSGQTTKYLYDKKKFNIIGLDFAEKSIKLAKKNFPQIEFKVDDMLNSKMSASSANGIVAFYSIVHFEYNDIKRVFKEWHRILKYGGFCLFSFHVGREVVNIKNFLEVEGANASWRFLDTDKIISLTERAGFTTLETIIRYPYKGYEHESKRAYILIKKIKSENSAAKHI